METYIDSLVGIFAVVIAALAPDKASATTTPAPLAAGAIAVVVNLAGPARENGVLPSLQPSVRQETRDLRRQLILRVRLGQSLDVDHFHFFQLGKSRRE
jgi:hypothetical protein